MSRSYTIEEILTENKKQFNDEYLKEYLENLEWKANPAFCEFCVIVRGVTKKNATFLDEWESLLYKNRNMCTKCFEFVNKNAGDIDLEKRLKLFEDITNIKIKR